MHYKSVLNSYVSILSTYQRKFETRERPVLEAGHQNAPTHHDTTTLSFFPAPTQENRRPPEEFNAIREKRKQAKLRYGSSHPARVKMAAEGPSRSLTDPADAQPLRVSPRESLTPVTQKGESTLQRTRFYRTERCVETALVLPTHS